MFVFYEMQQSTIMGYKNYIYKSCFYAIICLCPERWQSLVECGGLENR